MTAFRTFVRRLALITLLVSAVSACAQQPVAGSKRISEAIRPFVERRAVAGAVALTADANGVRTVDAIGGADVESGRPMKADSVFWIASQTKPITAVALMILVDEGKVRLDDPVAKYVPEFRDVWLSVEKDKDHQLLKRPARAITVRDVLSHTSGLPFASALETPTLDAVSLRDGAVSYAMTPLLFEPGTKYQYSNAGINVAGRIIEVVSGKTYEDFLNERVLKPLGMNETTFWPNDEQVARLATAYKPNSAKDGLEPTKIGQLRYPLSDRTRKPMPAGGLFSTASDLSRFCRMMLNKGTLDGRRILSESAVAELTRRQSPESVKESYGLGFSVGGGSFGHGGALSTNMNIDAKRGLITIWLVQHAGFPLDGAQAQGAFRRAAEEDFAASKK